MQRTVSFKDWGRIRISGRPPRTYSAVVKRDGATIQSEDIAINCAAPVPPVSSPEITVVDTCRSRNGFILFQYANPTSVSRPYIIEFEGVSNRSTTASAYGQAIRGTSGRPDGVYNYKIRTGVTVLKEDSVEVDCD